MALFNKFASTCSRFRGWRWLCITLVLLIIDFRSEFVIVYSRLYKCLQTFILLFSTYMTFGIYWMRLHQYHLKNYGDRGGYYGIKSSEISIILLPKRKQNSMIVLLFWKQFLVLKFRSQTWYLLTWIHHLYRHVPKVSHMFVISKVGYNIMPFWYIFLSNRDSPQVDRVSAEGERRQKRALRH